MSAHTEKTGFALAERSATIGVTSPKWGQLSWTEIASRTGVPLTDLAALVRGTVPESVAARLGVPLLSLDDFIVRGYTTASVAHRMGLSMAGAEALASEVGKEGRIGIVVGLLLSARKSRAAEAGRG